jgi:hypothetical protein
MQAMALPHGDGIEVACNLLRADITSVQMVRAFCIELVQAEGGEVASDYTIGLSAEELIALSKRFC